MNIFRGEEERGWRVRTKSSPAPKAIILSIQGGDQCHCSVRGVNPLGRVKFPNFFMAIPKNFLYGPASTLSTKFLKLSIRNHLGHSLEVLGWPQLQYSLSKITSPNLTFLFDCNFLGLLVDEEFMVCPTTFKMKILKFRGTSGY